MIVDDQKACPFLPLSEYLRPQTWLPATAVAFLLYHIGYTSQKGMTIRVNGVFKVHERLTGKKSKHLRYTYRIRISDR